MHFASSLIAILLGSVSIHTAFSTPNMAPADLGQPAAIAAPQPAIAQPVPVRPAPPPPPPVVIPAAEVTMSAADLESLDPGEFVWQPELSTTGPVEMVVSIPQQVAYVYRGGTLIGVTTVSTGRPGHRTPTGRFPIIEKRREHYSNLYNNAPMPFMQRLTMDGIALHAGQIPGRPASHGCVRLPLAFARHLFEVTSRGSNVHIIGDSPTAETALAMARGEPRPMTQVASAPAPQPAVMATQAVVLAGGSR